MRQLTVILLRLAVESAAEGVWRCVDAARAVLTPELEMLRRENESLRSRVECLERVERYTRRAQQARSMS